MAEKNPFLPALVYKSAFIYDKTHEKSLICEIEFTENAVFLKIAEQNFTFISLSVRKEYWLKKPNVQFTKR